MLLYSQTTSYALTLLFFPRRTCRQCCTENFRRSPAGNACNKCAGFCNTLSRASLPNAGLQVIAEIVALICVALQCLVSVLFFSSIITAQKVKKRYVAAGWFYARRSISVYLRLPRSCFILFFLAGFDVGASFGWSDLIYRWFWFCKFFNFALEGTLFCFYLFSHIAIPITLPHSDAFWLDNREEIRIPNLNEFILLFLEPVGSVGPKVSGGRLQEMIVEMNTTFALLCLAQSFPVPVFR